MSGHRAGRYTSAGVPRRNRNSPLGPVMAAVVASILVHLVLWPLGDRVMALGNDRDRPEPPSVLEVSLVPEPQEELAPVERPGQVVKLDEIDNPRPPKETERVAEFDNQTTRERARPLRRPKPTVPPPGNAKLTRPESSGGQDEAPKGAPLPLAGMRSAGDEGAGESARGSNPGAPGKGEAPSLSPRTLRGVPKPVLERPGASGSTQKIDDVESGDDSVMNARRWKYSSFFNRMRDNIEPHWDPISRLKARDPTGRINGTKQRRTMLEIVLNPDGSVNKINLVRSCGVDYLDREAISAVRSGAPFPNLPPGLLGEDGLFREQFGFIVDFTKSRIMRIRR